METKDMDRFIGKRVREERKRRGLTLEELSELCAMSVSYLGYVERGQKASSLTVLKKLSSALRVPISRFLPGTPFRAKDDHWDDLLSLAPMLRGQSPHNRRLIIRHWKDSFRTSKALFSRLK